MATVSLTYHETDDMCNHWRARVTLIQMLNDRKYDIIQNPWDPRHDTDNKIINPEFKKLWYEKTNFFSLSIKAFKREGFPRAPKIIIFFPDENKLKINLLREMVAKTKEEKCWHIIIVYKQCITAFAKNQLMVLKDTISDEEKKKNTGKNLRVEQFSIADLKYNVSHHKLVPPHRILSRTEADDVIKKLRCLPKNFPKIYTSDRVARYIGARQGQLIEIKKILPGGIRSTHYRICKTGTFKK